MPDPVTFKVIIGSITIVILIIFSALVSAAEVAYFSLTPKDIHKLGEENSHQSKRILHLLRDQERLLATLLIIYNFFNISIVIISAYLSAILFDFSQNPMLGFLIEVVVITFLILFLAEILPKLYATNFTQKVARSMSFLLIIMNHLLKPVSFILISSASLFKSRMRISRRHNLSLDDLSEALELTSNDGDEDKKILKGIVEFGNIEVKEIMCARTNVAAVEKSETLTAVLSVIVDSGYSRIPVYEGSFDNIKGILFVKDLLPYINKGDKDTGWLQLIRPAYFVPETKKINELLSEFQKNKIHMAVVVDEYGGTSGIVTMEDVLEEIVGEIADESDYDEPIYTRMDEKTYLFEGKILLNDFYKITHTEEEMLEKVVGEAETLAGLILEIKGEIPQKKEKITYRNFTFLIESVDKRRINQVKVIIDDEKGKK